jgi:arylsulfatase A-like enzyme
VLDHDPAVVAAAKELLNEDHSQPLFLFINLMTAHSPFSETDAHWVREHHETLSPEGAPEWLRPYLWKGEPRGVHLPQQAEGRHTTGVLLYLLRKLDIPEDGFDLLLDLYDGEVALVDRFFGAIFEHWAEQRPESIVVVTSDHGESFGEHGLLDHRASVYSELLSVPLVIAAPGRLPPGVRIQTPVQLQDLYPTLLDLAGIDSLPGSLVPVIRGEPRQGPITAAAWPDSVWARLIGGRLRHAWNLYRVGNEALVWSTGGELELYDLASDPAMTFDISGEQIDRVAALREEAAVVFEGVDAIQTEPVVLSAAAMERLRELGYLSD